LEKKQRGTERKGENNTKTLGGQRTCKKGGRATRQRKRLRYCEGQHKAFFRNIARQGPIVCLPSGTKLRSIGIVSSWHRVADSHNTLHCGCHCTVSLYTWQSDNRCASLPLG